MKRVNMLPSLLTLGNFACGVVAIALCLQTLHTGDGALIDAACWLAFAAMVFDMLDGRVARMTGAESRFGAELDSLADDCTFGVMPAMLVTTLWIQVQPPDAKWWGQVLFCGVVYAACAVLRLARYNVEVGKVDKNYFTGLPSPAAAGAVVSAVLFCRAGYLDAAWIWLVETVPVRNTEEYLQMEARALGVYMLFIGLLMVTRLRFVHMANRFLSGHKRFTYLVATVFAAFLFMNWPAETVFLTFNAYIFASLLYNIPRMAVTVQRWYTPRMARLRRKRKADGRAADAAPEKEADR